MSKQREVSLVGSLGEAVKSPPCCGSWGFPFDPFSPHEPFEQFWVRLAGAAKVKKGDKTIQQIDDDPESTR